MPRSAVCSRGATLLNRGIVTQHRHSVPRHTHPLDEATNPLDESEPGETPYRESKRGSDWNVTFALCQLAGINGYASHLIANTSHTFLGQDGMHAEVYLCKPVEYLEYYGEMTMESVVPHR